MIHPTTSKTLNVTPPAALVNNATVTVTSIDRHGFDYAVVRLILGATDIALTALKLQESDDNSTWTDISGLDYSVAGALPTATSDNGVFSFDVDLRARKRYLKPVVTVGSGSTGAYVAIIADLFRAEQTPHDATSRGLAGALAA